MSKNQKVSTAKPFKRIGRSYPDEVPNVRKSSGKINVPLLVDSIFPSILFSMLCDICLDI